MPERRLAIVENRSGYSTSDLTAFLERAFRALRVRRPIRVRVVPSPIFSRGCADVGRIACKGQRCGLAPGPRRMVIAIAKPSYQTPHEFLRRLARLVEHETWHVQGYDHDGMPEPILYSEGPTPRWAKGTKIRYLGRTPRAPAPRLVGGSY
jgi:hypothetical protein